MDRMSGGWGARIRTWECRYQKSLLCHPTRETLPISFRIIL
jgi:hypothetical protein